MNFTLNQKKQMHDTHKKIIASLTESADQKIKSLNLEFETNKSKALKQISDKETALEIEFQKDLDLSKSKLEQENLEKLETFRLENHPVFFTIPSVYNIPNRLRNDTKTDVKIICKDGELSAHRKVLELFQNKTLLQLLKVTKNGDYIINLDNYSKSSLSKFLDEIYGVNAANQLSFDEYRKHMGLSLEEKNNSNLDIVDQIYLSVLETFLSIPIDPFKILEQENIPNLSDTINLLKLFFYNFTHLDSPFSPTKFPDFIQLFAELVLVFDRHLVSDDQVRATSQELAQDFYESLVKQSFLGRNTYLTQYMQILVLMCKYHGFGCQKENIQMFSHNPAYQEPKAILAIKFMWHFYLNNNTEYLKKAAYYGHPDALNKIGESFFIDGDFKNAFENLEKASQLHNPIAQLALAYCLFHGKGCTGADPVLGFKWFSKSAELGNQKAFYAVGSCLLEGNGTEKDEKKGVEFLLKAVELPSKHGAYELGLCYEEGIVFEKDRSLARKYFQMAVDHQSYHYEKAKLRLKKYEYQYTSPEREHV